MAICDPRASGDYQPKIGLTAVGARHQNRMTYLRIVILL
jgi:hypothetical protein